MFNDLTIGIRNTWIYVIICGISLWLRQGFPMIGAPGMPHDDGYYQQMISSILSVNWLGNYNQMTLIKSPFYGFFGSLAFILGVPLKIAEHIFYLGASLYASRFLGKITGSMGLALFAFFLLAFNPVLWTSAISRLYRDGIYLSICLILFIQISALVFEKFEKLNIVERKYATVVAAIVGAYVLSREESIWMVPCCLIVIALSFTRVNPGMRILAAKNMLIGSAFISILTFIFISFVGLTNFIQYKIFTIDEQHESSFLSAYGSLARIDVPERLLVPVTQKARKLAYANSPAAKELEQYLEGDLGRSWAENGCKYLNPAICDDIAGGWFMWALRDAVALAGHYSNGQSAAEYYDRITNEINNACSQKIIKCKPNMATVLPPFTYSRAPELFLNFLKVIQLEIDWSLAQVSDVQTSIGGYQAIVETRDVAGDVLDSNQKMVIISGWETSPGQLEPIILKNSEGQNVEIMPDLPAQDVQLVYPHLKSKRFHYIGLCSSPCQLSVKGNSFEPMQGSHFDIEGITVHVDNYNTVSHKLQEKMRKLKVSLVNITIPYFRIFLQISFFIAFLGLSVNLIDNIKSKRLSKISILQIALLVAILSRAFILAYIDTMLFPAINMLYMLPVSTFVILFIAIGCYQLSIFYTSLLKRLL